MKCVDFKKASSYEKSIKILGEQNVIFTYFTPPKNWQDEHGSWQTYYKINQKP